MTDKVMPFYNYYVATQATEFSPAPPRVLEKAVQSNDWQATGQSSGPESIAWLKQGLEVTYAKNSQHIAVDITQSDEHDADASGRERLSSRRITRSTPMPTGRR